MKNKQHTLRVSPDYAAAVRTFILRYEMKANWDKVDHDTHTLFSGSKSVIDQIHAFICGWQAAKELMS